MAYEIQDPSSATGAAGYAPTAGADGNPGKDGRVALQASLEGLEQLLESLLAGSGETKGADGQDMLQQMLSQLGPLLQRTLHTDPTRTGHVLAQLRPLFDRLASKDPEAAEKVKEEFAPLFAKYIKEGKGEDVAVATGTFASAASPEMKKHVGDLGTAVVGCQAAMLAGDVSAEESSQIADFLRSIFGSGNPQGEIALEKQLEQMLIQLKSEGSEAKFQSFLNELEPILSIVALHGNQNLDVVANDLKAMLPTIYNLGDAARKAFFGSLKSVMMNLLTTPGATVDEAVQQLTDVINRFTCDAATKNQLASQARTLLQDFNSSGNQLKGLAAIFAGLILAIQELEAAVMDSQGKKDKILAEMGQARVKAAQENLQNTINKINKYNEEKAQQHTSSIFGWIIKIVVAIVGVLIAALTMGAMAAIVVVAVTAFMMSPLFNDCVKALSGAIAKGLESMGMPKDEAQHFADAIAKVVILIAIVLISFGVGGFEAVGEEATDETVDEVANEAADDVTDGLADAGDTDSVEGDLEDEEVDETDTENNNNNKKTNRKIRFNRAKGAKFAKFQFWSNLGSMNPMMDALEAIPGLKKIWGGKLLLILDALTELLCMIMSMRAGKELMEGGPDFMKGKGSDNWFVRNYSNIGKVARYTQGTFELAGAAATGTSAYYQFQMADTQQAEAKCQAEQMVLQLLIELNSQLQTTNQKTSQEILKQLEQAGRLAQQGAGLVGYKVNEALAQA